MYETILVATDGSESASRAVDHAVDITSMFDAELHGISVVDTRRYGDSMVSGSESVLDELKERAEKAVEDVGTGAGVDAATEIRRGRPHEQIGEYADEIDADLIVLGNRGLGSSAEIGSNAERVVRHVDRPVLTA